MNFNTTLIQLLFFYFIGPLPIQDLRAEIDEKTWMVEVSWIPENASTQDTYRVQYHEVEATIGGDSNVLTTNKTRVIFYIFDVMVFFNENQGIPFRFQNNY
jgi:hypothetical protein